MLSAQDIQSQQFHMRFRGFDVEEVDEFLEQVAEAFLALGEENTQMKERLTTLEQELASYRSQEKAFQNAILSAQAIADQMEEKSRQEAEKILSAAKQEAAGLRESASQEIVHLEQEVERLKGLRASLQTELRRLLEGYLALLETPAAEPAGAVDTAEAATGETKETEEEELDDLYQKIALGEPDPPSREETGSSPTPDLPDSELLDLESASEPAATVPDLDSDISFSLEDPLDEQEPEVRPAAGKDQAADQR